MSNPDIIGKSDKVLRPVLKELHRFPWMHVEVCCAGHKPEDSLWLEVRVLDMIEAFDRIFLDPAAQEAKDRSRPKYHYVIVDYLCERLAGEARAASDVTDIAYATEQELEKFQMTSTAMRVLRRAFAMDQERRKGR